MTTGLFLFLSYLFIVLGDEHSHTYEVGEEVVLWMNTVGPIHNRQETYGYFTLPFCRGRKQTIEHAHETLGEALQGFELQYSGIDIRFKDDLPVWGSVGDASTNGQTYVWTQKILEIGYNGNQIVSFVLINDDLVEPKVGSKLTSSYTVRWIELTVAFENRFDSYLDYTLFEHKIHWFSIFNTFMMVLFLVALVSIILMRTLRRDYARYNKESGFSDMDKDLGDEYGWKQVHSDVFRTPSYMTLLCCVVGTGIHMSVVVFLVLLLALTNKLHTERGSIVSTFIFIYSATSPLNGLVGGSLYARMSGKRWIRQFLFGASFFPILVCSATFFVNLISMYYHTSRAISFLVMLAMMCIVLFVIIPLNLVGTVLGRNLFGKSNLPCRVNSVPKPIPEKKWFMEPTFLIMVGGILPFGSIFIELYFVFTSFWAYKIYFVFGFTLLVLVLLFAVTSSSTVVGVYFLLNSEDYRWQWTSFLSGASIAIYAYLYSAYYFFFKTKMFGLFQTTFYFSYMAVFCISLGIMCGSIGYIVTSQFIRKIYSTLKID